MTTFGKEQTIFEQIVPVVLHDIQSHAGADYAVSARADHLHTANLAENLIYRFDKSGVETASADNAWRWKMRFVGCGTPTDQRLNSVVDPVSQGNRVEYRHESIVEWYLNGPFGLEQGFTLIAPPAHAGDARQLAVTLAFEGDLFAAFEPSAQRIDLLDSQCNRVLTYGQLHVSDATGRVLPSHFSINHDGTTTLASITFDVDGAVYPITVDPLIKRASLISAADSTNDARFGFSVSINGTTAVVGAYRANTAAGTEAGAAYVFVRNAQTGDWVQQAKLTAADGASGDQFGYGVSIDVDTIVVGAAYAHIGSYADAGAAYVFTRSGTTWTQQAKLSASNLETGARFGFAVSVNGDSTAIGAPNEAVVDIDQGAAYVFTRSGTTWSQQQRFTFGGQNDNFFGCSLALRGNKLVIGGSDYDEPAVAQGIACIYTRSGTNWTLQQLLKLTTGVTGDNFGTSVAMSPNGKLVIVGSPGRDTNFGTNGGSAFIYTWNGTTWALDSTLLIDGGANARFGQSVAISDKAALVGSTAISGGRGTAYYFQKTPSSWEMRGYIGLNDAAASENYATSLAMTNDIVIAGVPGRSSGYGAAHIFANGPGEHLNPCDPVCGIVVAGKEKIGNPITIRDGEKQEEALDLQINSPFGALELKRVYRQNAHDDYQFMGLGWTHSHAITLDLIGIDPADPDAIILHWGNGAQADFLKSSTNNYEGSAGVIAQITRNPGNGQFTLTTSGRAKITFDSTGRALEQEASAGERLTYSYSAGKLTQVVDDYGRKLVFRYYTSGSFNGQLYRVGDHTFNDADPLNPTGRYVEYAYTLNKMINSSSAIVTGTGALLTSVRDVRGNVWTYDYYGQAALETDVRQLNYLTTAESPSVDTTGDGVADAPIVIEEVTYGMQGNELAVNGTMELDAHWTGIVGALPTTNQRSTMQVDSGTHSRRVVASAANQGIEGEPWSLLKDNTYIVSARAYVVSGAVKMQVSGETGFDRLSSGTGSWQTLYVVHTPTADAPSPRRLQFIASGGAAEFFIDTVSIIEADGRVSAITQARGNAALTTDYAFHLESNTLTTETVAGKVTNHWFDEGVYAGAEDPASNANLHYVNPRYRPVSQIDANRRETTLAWSADGKLLDRVVDPLGHQTQFNYHTSGASQDALQEAIDPQGRKTEYLYDDPAHPRLPTAIRVIDGTTVLQWQTFSYDSKGRTLSEKTVDPANGTTPFREVTRTYGTSGNGHGLLESVTQVDVGNSANNSSTSYTYDAAGRVVRTQQSSLFGSCKVSYTVFDAAGNVVASICNYENAGAAPTTAAEAEALFNPAFPDRNKVTTHVYDAAGRRVATTTDAGASYAQTTLTVYDGLGRVIRTIARYVPNAAIPHPYTAPHAAFTHGADLSENRVNDTAYNARGMVRRQVDVLGNVTLYGYDDAGRVIRTVSSASQPNYNNDYSGTLPDPTLANYVANSAPDQDVISSTIYDPVGNVVASKDALGHTHFTVYDALDRPIKSVQFASAPNYNILADKVLTSYTFSPDPDKDIVTTTDYDVMGRTIRTTDALGSVTLYGFDALGRQVRVIRNASAPGYSIATDPDLSAYTPVSDADRDLITDTVYDEQGRMLYSVSVSGERTWQGYDTLGRVIKTIANAVGTATNGGVNDPRSSSYIPSTAADRDLITRTEYDGDGRVQWTQDAIGRKTWMVYDALGRQKKVIRNCTYTTGSPAPEGDTYVGQHATDSAKDVITRTVYDSQGRVAATIDSHNRETRFEYDVLGRRVKTIRSYVDGVYSSAAPDQDVTETTVYDLAGRVAKTIDNAGQETRFEYDLLGRRVRTISFYQDGVYSAVQPDRDLIAVTSYNKGGQVVSTTDARGTVTAFAYDNAGRQRQVTQAANTPLATTSYTCFDKGGRVLRTIQNYIFDPLQPAPDAKDAQGNYTFAPTTHGAGDDLNLITTYTHDKLGRQVAVRDVLGNQTATTYGKDGQVVASSDPLGVITRFVYDRMRRRTMVVQHYTSNGEDPALWLWDGVQNRWETSAGAAIAHGVNNDQNVIVRVAYDKAGRPLNQRDPRGSLTSYTHDLLDRRLTLTNPLNHTWATAYQDVPTGETNTVMTLPGLATGGDYAVTRAFDRLGRLAEINYGSAAVTPTIGFAYDAAGNRIRMTEMGTSALVRETTYSHDAARRLTSVGFDHDGGGIDETVSYAYDAGGLRTRMTLPGGLDVNYQYDAKGRLIGLTDWDSQATGFTHDAIGRHILTERANGLTSRYRYDAAGRLTRLQHSAKRRMLADFAYTVDARGNRTTARELLTQPGAGGATIDKDHQAVTIVRGTWTDAGAFKVSDSISAALRIIFSGDELTLTLGMGPDHGLIDLYIDGAFWDTFDGYAPTASEAALPIALLGDGIHTLELRNRSDRNGLSSGNSLRFKQLVTNRDYRLHTWKYTYDGLARVIAADQHRHDDLASVPETAYGYAFDLAGNRTRESVAIDGDTPTVINTSYNAANQIADTGFTYDPNGNMTHDGANAYTWDRANRLLSMGGHSYTYDGNGDRRTKTVSGIVTRYLLDVQPGLAQVIAATTGTDTTRYIYSPRGIHAQETPAGAWQFPLTDGLGSVRTMTGDLAAVLQTTDYDPFGVPESPLTLTDFAFTGEQRDGTGLQYHRARYVNPSLGVFASLDPFEGMMCRPMSLNGYGWVTGNPINRADPSGYFDVDTCTVVYGDYLEKIAIDTGVILSSGSPIPSINPSLAERREGWQLIASANPAIDPHRIFPGDKLILPPNALGACQGSTSVEITPPVQPVRPYIPPMPSATCPGELPPQVSPIRAATIVGGYVEGVALGATGASINSSSGSEVVYNFTTFERMGFSYESNGFSIVPIGVGGNATIYLGHVEQFVPNASPEPFGSFRNQYLGSSVYSQGGGGPTVNLGFISGSVSGGIVHVHSPAGALNPIYGNNIYVNASLTGVSGEFMGVSPDGAFGLAIYSEDVRYGSPVSYINPLTRCVDRNRLGTDIRYGFGSPLPGGFAAILQAPFVFTSRVAISIMADIAAKDHNDKIGNCG